MPTTEDSDHHGEADEQRDPAGKMARLNTSRPNSSVPNQ